MYLFCPYCGLDLRFIIRERLIARLTLHDRILRMLVLMRNPLNAIEHIASAPDLLGGAIICVLCSFVLLIKLLMLMVKYSIPINAYGVVCLLVASVLTQFLVWIFLAIVLHVGIRVAGGVGSFRDIMSIVGYCQLYLLIGHIVSMVMLSFVPPSPDPSELSRALLGSAEVYAPFLIFIAILVGYGASFTHMLKKPAAILASVASSTILIVLLYAI